MENRIKELEKRLAFSENTIEELMEALSDTDKRINQLEKKIQHLASQLTDERLVKDPGDEDEKPPHY